MRACKQGLTEEELADLEYQFLELFTRLDSASGESNPTSTVLSNFVDGTAEMLRV